MNSQDPAKQPSSAVALPNVEEDQTNKGADTDENMSPSGRKFK